jgi:pimeloyl-ACP methyl ester carboxylesterase
LKLLVEGKDGLSFHVVAPSLPNFGFSEGVKKRGFDLTKYAEAVHKVMIKLGYEKYGIAIPTPKKKLIVVLLANSSPVTQGGDWGSEITRAIGFQYPNHCVASNINLIICEINKLEEFVANMTEPLTALEKAGLERDRWFNQEGFGYNKLQSTKPHTLSFALRDPVALLSWIYEKLHDWTDSYPWTDNEILTWVSIYQFSRAGPEASVRIYYEAKHMDAAVREKYWEYIDGVKLGLSYFPRDLNLPPSAYGRTLGDVVFERRHEDGGHFAAWERPETLVGDLFEMFGKGGGAEELVRGIVQ